MKVFMGFVLLVVVVNLAVTVWLGICCVKAATESNDSCEGV